LQVGVKQTFQATLRSIKAPELIGSPKFKPGVGINYGSVTRPPGVSGTEVTVTTADGTVTSTFSSSIPVDWRPIDTQRIGFSMLPVVSEVTPPPPPFHVIVPAAVRIEPETLNLNNPGVLTAFLTLEAPYNVQSVHLSTVTCNGSPALSGTIAGNGLILKFRVEDLTGVGSGEEASLTVAGALIDGSLFSAMDTIRIIDVR
jgi:hypothetical protein